MKPGALSLPSWTCLAPHWIWRRGLTWPWSGGLWGGPAGSQVGRSLQEHGPPLAPEWLWEVEAEPSLSLPCPRLVAALKALQGRLQSISPASSPTAPTACLPPPLQQSQRFSHPKHWRSCALSFEQGDSCCPCGPCSFPLSRALPLCPDQAERPSSLLPADAAAYVAQRGAAAVLERLLSQLGWGAAHVAA